MAYFALWNRSRTLRMAEAGLSATHTEFSVKSCLGGSDPHLHNVGTEQQQLPKSVIYYTGRI